MTRIITLRENLNQEELFEQLLNDTLEKYSDTIHSIHVSESKYGTRIVTIILNKSITK